MDLGSPALTASFLAFASTPGGSILFWIMGGSGMFGERKNKLKLEL